jgi:hypothetical protein
MNRCKKASRLNLAHRGLEKVLGGSEGADIAQLPSEVKGSKRRYLPEAMTPPEQRAVAWLLAKRRGR